MNVLLAGATGLVGAHTLARLRTDGARVVTVGRRLTGHADEEIVAPFTKLPALPAADVGVCCLGTTLAAAGNEEAMRAVDQHAVVAFANAAHRAGAEHFIVVTAVGADPSSAIFYNRLKGEVESDLVQCRFRRLDILQPGLLLGARSERRPVEAFMQLIAPALNPLMVGRLARYGAIDADEVAAAIVALTRAAEPGVWRHENPDIRQLAL